jgi:hypothetical protein
MPASSSRWAQALGVIWLDPETLGNGVDSHIALHAVAREVADRP